MKSSPSSHNPTGLSDANRSSLRRPSKSSPSNTALKFINRQRSRPAKRACSSSLCFKQADAGVVAAYGRILPDWMLNAPRHGCVNVHSSLLPKYRGAAPINWAIARGERETGVTIMRMDAGLDTGPVLLRRATAIGDEETAAELTPRLAELGAESLIETLSRIERGEITPQPQNDAEATLAPILKREDGEVDWTMTAAEIFNRLRGFTPFPGCYTFFQWPPAGDRQSAGRIGRSRRGSISTWRRWRGGEGKFRRRLRRPARVCGSPKFSWKANARWRRAIF